MSGRLCGHYLDMARRGRGRHHHFDVEGLATAAILPSPLSNQLFCVRGDHRTAKLYVVCSPAVVTVQNSAEIQLKMLCGEGSMHGAGKWEISPNSLFFKCASRNDLSELVE
jgi:hypothetical protein